MKNLKITIFFIAVSALLSFSFQSTAQLITTYPLFPVAGDSVVLTFDAALGNGGLEGYDGDVYAHTGVITEESGSVTDWKYVKTDWGQNTPETKLERIGDDLYSLNIGPSIRDYYGVPQNEQILQMAFVFRSEDSQLAGRDVGGLDIFVEVYQAELGVVFIEPDVDEVIVQENDEVPVNLAGNFSDSLLLYVDDVLISSTNELLVLDTIVAQGEGKHWVKGVAKNDTGMVADSFYYFVRGEVTVEALPAGVQSGINYLNENTVTLALTAPGKEFVFVIGDFNNWQLEEEFFMKMTPDGEKWWLEIDGLVPQQQYIFQYFVDGVLKIADPYTEQISDPWNDKYISGQTYPGLIEYPEGKTTGIAAVLQTAQEEYDWVVEDFTSPPVEELVVYEILIRDFTEEHTYEAMKDTLGYLEELGITAVELMPVNEFEGNSSWGYNPSFYFAPDKYYGPKDKLKAFIDECHQRGIAVIIDMVLNHSYDQSPFVQLYFDGDKPTEDNPWYNREHNFTNPDAQWGNDFNHESPYTKELVDSINTFWMSEYKVDGFRFDFTKGIGNNIKGPNDPWGSNYDADRIALLKRMADEIWERNPDALVILEHLAENSEEKELANYGMLMWGNLNYNYSEGVMGYNEAGKSDFSWISYQKRGWSDPHVIGYMESHDEERVMYKSVTFGNSHGTYDITDTNTAINRVAMAATFFFPIPGPKMIWQFGELGYAYSIDFNGRLGEKPVRWDYYQQDRRRFLYNMFKELIHLKLEYDVFKTEDYTLNVHGTMKQIQLDDDEMNVCIIGNFGVQDGTIEADFRHTGMWYDYFTGDSLMVGNTPQQIDLQQGEFHLYTNVKLTTPETGLGVDEPGDVSSLIKKLYPNPTNGHFSLELDVDGTSALSVSLYDHNGRFVQSLDESQVSGKTTLSYNLSVPAGLYFISVQTESERAFNKVVVL
ncbi:MAG: T9SS type A sorting domain-containing protein [Bacteroidales bacterium]|nr:T9SS type A sorting domain-containing protein [Bacteroidales bacterium]MCF8350017.1 T9SS type A sorting domain-containing protein [Bacteroidales bacterium]MCF8376354.1 T9SS type A sorting domain-containing protein [Bacteroidales bacterium]MCF8400520.1 T9SS type A sorting domain-containing protein [Bacteroidales bacterium]